jgi:hypothetical protein
MASRQTQERLYQEQMGAEALAEQRRAGAPKCRACAKPIRWATAGNGKHVMLDFDEHEGGNVFRFDDGTCRTGRQDDPTPPGAKRFYKHEATCLGKPAEA